MYAGDALFGANFDAYSVKWLGASQVNPAYKAVAMRWAILGAEEATEPEVTTFVLPCWDDKGSSYARWLSHQTVQAIATIDRSKFRFNAPRHWADEQDQWCTPKRNVHFLIVANEAGLQRFVKQETAWEPTTKAKTAEEDHTANSLTARTVPTQALLQGPKHYNHSMVT